MFMCPLEKNLMKSNTALLQPLIVARAEVLRQDLLYSTTTVAQISCGLFNILQVEVVSFNCAC